MKTLSLSPEALRSTFLYKDGELYWRTPGKGRKMTTPVGCTSSGGYRVVWALGSLKKLHRVVWALHFGDPGAALIDHVDGDATNNRVENLRLASHTTNGYNAKKNSRNTSGVTGVSRTKNGRKWKVQLTVSGKVTVFGEYDTIPEARRVYAIESTKNRGEFVAALGAQRGVVNDCA